MFFFGTCIVWIKFPKSFECTKKPLSLSVEVFISGRKVLARAKRAISSLNDKLIPVSSYLTIGFTCLKRHKYQLKTLLGMSCVLTGIGQCKYLMSLPGKKMVEAARDGCNASFAATI